MSPAREAPAPWATGADEQGLYAPGEGDWLDWGYDDGWNDDAYLHYIPEEEAVAGPSRLPDATQASQGARIVRSPSLEKSEPAITQYGTARDGTSAPKKRGRPKKAVAKEGSEDVAGPSNVATVATQGAPKAAKRRQGRPKKTAGEDDNSDAEDGKVAGECKDLSEEFNAKFREAILADEELHHRILRYEVRSLDFQFYLHGGQAS